MKLSVIQIAKICHEANRAYCEELRDFSQNQWDVAVSSIKESAVAGVLFRLNHPEMCQEAQHVAWVASKERAGWRYGPIKSIYEKTHPCMVPYAELPEEQQVKDALFIANVLALRPYAIWEETPAVIGEDIPTGVVPDGYVDRISHAEGDIPTAPGKEA